jgi:hypothetical protein
MAKDRYAPFSQRPPVLEALEYVTRRELQSATGPQLRFFSESRVGYRGTGAAQIASAMDRAELDEPG